MIAQPPRRFVYRQAALEKFGPAVDTLAALLTVGDPLADDLLEATKQLPSGALHDLVERALKLGIDRVPDAPRELKALFAELDHIPAWVDKHALERGGELLFRAGWLGGLALACSLLYGYASPGGNKPLVFSGRLEQQTPRRLIETSRFVEATCHRNGLLRHGEGFAITVKVRLMHAHVRRMIAKSGRWSVEDWGLPANQHDMGATGLLFSFVVIETLARFGFELSEEERHLYMQLWRYSGYLMGVHPEVLPAGYLDARRLAELIATTEQGPDDDSRRLSRALFATGESPRRSTPAAEAKARRLVKIGQGLIRGALGEELADNLDVPRHAYRHVFPVLRGGIARFERATRRLPEAAQLEIKRRAMRQGQAYWSMMIGAADWALTFAPPDGLLGLNAKIAAAASQRGATLASVARPR
ncbi:MAG: DUF2236 domain-containing protein [Polyangiaceae bacterium]|jgi:hypothetical protein|nr:DUF2236 domain-containing protein [Polyangiaceae bacterium]MBK8937396.1 DUF2236 domain-containing protein [Polyangiaceae bacterium]